MKELTAEEFLAKSQIDVERLKEEKPLLHNTIIRCMQEYAQAYHKQEVEKGNKIKGTVEINYNKNFKER